jgi:hypothetical protein
VAEQAEDANDRRRSNRMSVRLSGVFGGRARRERSPQQMAESDRSDAQAQNREESPATDGAGERRA